MSQDDLSANCPLCAQGHHTFDEGSEICNCCNRDCSNDPKVEFS